MYLGKNLDNENVLRTVYNAFTSRLSEIRLLCVWQKYDLLRMMFSLTCCVHTWVMCASFYESLSFEKILRRRRWHVRWDSFTKILCAEYKFLDVEIRICEMRRFHHPKINNTLKFIHRMLFFDYYLNCTFSINSKILSALPDNRRVRKWKACQ